MQNSKIVFKKVDLIMTQEDKELLLKDLCTRLPYGVKCKVNYMINNETTYGEDVESECIDIIKRISFDTYSVYTEWLGYESDIEDVKPYLRPMSSMTEEEKEEYEHIASGIEVENGIRIPNVNQIEWLNRNHFDYRGLIPMELALEAPNDMYIKKK